MVNNYWKMQIRLQFGNLTRTEQYIWNGYAKAGDYTAGLEEIERLRGISAKNESTARSQQKG